MGSHAVAGAIYAQSTQFDGSQSLCGVGAKEITSRFSRQIEQSYKPN
jgi:hypothetical protein